MPDELKSCVAQPPPAVDAVAPDPHSDAAFWQHCFNDAWHEQPGVLDLEARAEHAAEIASQALNALRAACAPQPDPEADWDPDDEVEPVLDGEAVIHLTRDGNKWWALLGEDLQVGLAGFDDTRSGALHTLADVLKARGE